MSYGVEKRGTVHLKPNSWRAAESPRLARYGKGAYFPSFTKRASAAVGLLALGTEASVELDHGAST